MLYGEVVIKGRCRPESVEAEVSEAELEWSFKTALRGMMQMQG